MKYESLGISFDYLTRAYEYLSEEIKGITREVMRLSESDHYHERVELLRPVPGIGRLTAMEIPVELGEIERFRTRGELASYLGLTPSEYSTGEKIRHGRITRCGNARVRTALVESSWSAIAKDPLMRAK